MIFLSKEEWSNVWSVSRLIIPAILALSILFGFVSSVLVPYHSPEENYEHCTYDSIASRLNVGYVLGCELFRKRWAKEPVCTLKKIVSHTAKGPNHYNWHDVILEDGSIIEMRANTKNELVGLMVRSCK